MSACKDSLMDCIIVCQNFNSWTIEFDRLGTKNIYICAFIY